MPDLTCKSKKEYSCFRGKGVSEGNISEALFVWGKEENI